VVVPPLPGHAQIQADGFNVPWAVGGPRIERDGSKIEYAGDWPTVHFSFQRLWDTRTAWLNLEPARDLWAFDHLDELIQKANDNGVTDVMLVLAGTPSWAASQTRSTDAAWMGPGSASMPANIEDWRSYVTTVATRYAGRVSSYEIGNEPNLVTYWNGTPEQWAQYVGTAVEAIQAADPMATVLVSGGLVRNRADIARLATWLKPIANLASDGRVDGVAVHFYPDATSMPSVALMLANVAVALDRCGWGDVSRWITEINVTGGADLSSADQVSSVSDLTAAAEKAGFQRLYWYAWTDLGPDDLMPFQPGSAGEEAVGALD
jgi:GH35 family endo-1,4-beta-xylanase